MSAECQHLEALRDVAIAALQWLAPGTEEEAAKVRAAIKWADAEIAKEQA